MLLQHVKQNLERNRTVTAYLLLFFPDEGMHGLSWRRASNVSGRLCTRVANNPEIGSADGEVVHTVRAHRKVPDSTSSRQW